MNLLPRVREKAHYKFPWFGGTNNRPFLWKRLGLVDKHTLLFKRMLELSDMQIQSLVPRQF